MIRKAIKTPGPLPSEKAAEKLICLAIREHEKTARNVRGWRTAVNQSAIMFDDRFNPLGGGRRSNGNEPKAHPRNVGHSP
ncbi:hypothetical protein GI374_14005 [Paracoccus sp. S-4012]|uniref:hypothetical protein n=1 Tax=Paracoccus sp. S-4012 TaxID=2665648 RepID=UPI001321159A|nr:hypothetical protein [Paracoccus sp. S-4012]MRX51532.1 hypothetical protein [Paracoccus sp. S-4012]